VGEDLQESEAVCIPHAVSFLVFFVDGGGVHLARRLFFDCPSPPSCEIDNETVCIPHAGSFVGGVCSTRRLVVFSLLCPPQGSPLAA